MSERRALVLLATLDGERWLEEQITSIQAQDVDDWLLLVSDDGSSDRTLSIVGDLAASDSRIQLLPKRHGFPGHAANFEYLLQQSRAHPASLIALCDQDDQWRPDKLRKLGDALGREADQGALLAYSQLALIGASGNQCGLFFGPAEGVSPLSVGVLLRQARIPGCSMAIVPELRDWCLPFPPKLVNHDWWLSICAALLGDIAYLGQPLTCYRQHGENQVGAGLRFDAIRLMPGKLRRQRDVFQSKQLAVKALIDRQTDRTDPAIELLKEWHRELGGPLGTRTSLALARSRFRADSRLLQLVQMMAVSPVGRWLS